MRYLLKSPYALRGWQKYPYTLCENGVHNPHAISLRDMAFLASCDGNTDVKDAERAQEFLTQGVIEEAVEGQCLKEWQTYRYYDNLYFKAVSFAPTLRCNYNCLHCFNAKDENKSVAELTYEECLGILDEMVDCGIGAVRFTGGEPFVHKRFLDLVLEAHRRGIEVEEILTNGSLLTQEVFDAFRNEPLAETSLGVREVLFPLLMISFDGVGTHEWLRDVKGSEQAVLQAMKLAVKNGFNVSVHLCVHRRNADNLMETARLLSDIGVSAIRIIRTSESPRWLRTAGDASISLDEFFEKLLTFFQSYREEKLKPMLELTWILRYFPRYDGKVEWLPEHRNKEELLKYPICCSVRSYFHVAADRNVYPCNVMSGAMRAFGYETPHIIDTPLREILQPSSMMDQVCSTFADMRDQGAECYECEFVEDCQGGCRALAYGTTQDYLGPDIGHCVLHKHGYARRFHEIIEG